jgi:hypothetical protein
VAGLSLIIVHWSTVYLDRAVRQLRARGTTVPNDLLAHVAPLGWEHIGLTGDYVWSAPDPAAPFRPLREVRAACPRNFSPSLRCHFGGASLSALAAGALVIVAWNAAAWNTSRTFGDALFLFAAFLSACFSAVMRRAKLEPLHAAALVSIGSLVIYLPVYLALHGTRLAAAAARRNYASGDFPGRSRDHYFPPSLWPRGCHPRRFAWCRLWCLGAGTIKPYLITVQRQQTDVTPINEISLCAPPEEA